MRVHLRVRSSIAAASLSVASLTSVSLHAQATTKAITKASVKSVDVAPTDSAHLRLAREVVHAAGADSLVLRGLETMLAAQKMTNTTLPAEFWDAFMTHARKTLPELIETLVPIYAAHFSTAELTQLKAFYLSPIGKRLVAEQATIQQESAKVGMRWGAKIGGEVSGELMTREVPASTPAPEE